MIYVGAFGGSYSANFGYGGTYFLPALPPILGNAADTRLSH